MVGISLQELVIIAMVAIIFIPPKDIPTLIRGALNMYKKWQTLYTKLLRELQLLDLDK